MRIALICHFSNKEVQNIIKPWKKINEFAPWISYYIDEFWKHPEHHFYIISPHQWLKKDKIYTEGNITFYLFKYGVPLIGRRWPFTFDLDYYTGYKKNIKKVKNYIDAINPDVINLIGAENPYYSSSIMQFKDKYPVLLTIQGFVGRARLDFKLTKYWKYRLDLENSIISTFNHFCIRTEEMFNYIKTINPQAIAYRFNFPTPYGKIQITEKKKEYDFVFFARISKEKGIYDYLNAIKNIKNKLPTIKAIIVGPCSIKMKNKVLDYIKANNIQNNIEFIGFLPNQHELFVKIKSAKISVLPTYNDLISGTIIESMFLSLPVVTYRTGSIPEVNKDRENILICEQGNQQALAQEMYRLLMDTTLQEELSLYGKEWVSERYNNEKAMSGYFKALKQIIKEFKNKRN